MDKTEGWTLKYEDIYFQEIRCFGGSTEGVSDIDAPGLRSCAPRGLVMSPHQHYILLQHETETSQNWTDITVKA